jgi:hypothetical protein
MAYMGDDDNGGIVRDLQLKVEFLDGWRIGESERYDRLERDLTRLADEVALLRQETRAEFGSVRAEIGSVRAEIGDLRRELMGVSTRTHTELRLMMVLMLSGMFMLWLNSSG